MNDTLNTIPAKKSLGQHFLNNENIPRLMADTGEVQEGDVVLEIGPGTGVLTRELLRRGARVIALEADARAIESLQEPFSAEITAKRLTIFHTDIRTANFASFGLTEHAYKVVANIPYYLSGMLFRLFLESSVQPSDLVFLVQKEVAERIARDKKESLLSLSVKAFGAPKYIKTVARGNFTPSPRVDSAIITVTHISHDNFKDLDEKFFFEVLHAGFASKRKQLLGNLTKLQDRETLVTVFSNLGIPLDARGEDLPLEVWLKLTISLSRTT